MTQEITSRVETTDAHVQQAADTAATRMSHQSYAPGSSEPPARRPEPAHGSIDVPNPYPQPQPEHTSWTVAVDLTTNLNPPGHPKEYGAERQFRDLQGLIQETQGKSVTFVVQIARQSEEQQRANRESDPSQMTQPQATIDRYVIRDGHMEQIASVQSRGMAGNVEDLLRAAQSVAPSDHIGLIAQSHGAGTQGIIGDSGNASMPELVQAVHNGLNGGHADGQQQSDGKRLDFIDFDSCSMGNAGSLSQARQIADHVVASEEPEAAAGTNDAQRLRTVLSDVLQQPSMTPAQVADDFVQEANKGANGKPQIDEDNGHPHTGTDTLASFDASRYPQFQEALNGLGQTLSRAMNDPHNAAAIHQLLDTMPQQPSDPAPHEMASGERDVSTLVQQLHTAIADGKIADRDGSIGSAADRLLQADKEMTSKFHGEPTGGYDRLSGLTVYLPGSDITDPSKRAAGASELTVLRDSAEHSAKDVHGLPPLQARAMAVTISEQLSQGMSPEATQQFAPVLEASRHVRDAHDEKEFRSASAELVAAVDGIKGSAAEREIKQHELDLARHFTSQFISHGEIQGADAWNAFVRRLAG